MAQRAVNNQGFTRQQKQELTEILQLVLKPFDKKFSAFEKRIEAIELRLTGIERDMRDGFVQLKEKIDELRDDINAYRSNFVHDDERIKTLQRRVAKLEKRILVKS